MTSVNSILLLFVLLIHGLKFFPCDGQKYSDKQGVYRGHVTVEGTDLDYTVEGVGLPCLVIGSSVYYPRTFSEGLRKHLRLFFVDLRWFAKKYVPVNTDDFSLETIIKDIEMIRSELKLEKMIIMGHSIHGTIAFEYAKIHPDRISHIIMIGSPPVAGNQKEEDAINELWDTASDERKGIMDKNWKTLAGMKNLSPEQADIETYVLMGPEYWYDANYDARWLWNGMTIHSELLHHLYDKIFSDYYMFKNSRQVPAPAFVALGRYDYVDPYTLWDDLKDIQGLTIRLFDNCGHTPQLEQSNDFDQEVVRWINEIQNLRGLK